MKKPKRPKSKSSVAVWENYDRKYSEWKRAKARKEALMKKKRD